MHLLLLLLCVLCGLPCLALRAPVQSINSLIEEKQRTPAELIDMTKLLCSTDLQPVDRRKTACSILERIQRNLVGAGGATARSEVLSDDRFHNLLLCATYGLDAQYGSAADVDIASSIKVVRALAVLSDGSYSLHPNVLEKLLPLLLYKQAQTLRKSKGSLRGSDIETLEWSYSRLVATSEAFGRLVDSNADVMDSLNALIEEKEQLSLPFQVLHGITGDSGVSLEQLVSEIPFKNEHLVTRTGKKVVERRMTSWMVEDGSNIGGLAYSGKVMKPRPFSKSVAIIRDLLEERTGLYFDCCLANLYEDGECACAWHADPDMGSMWSTDSIICSFGETRRFSVRSLGDSVGHTYTYHLHGHDAFLMYGSCNDAYQHCILGAENGEFNGGARLSIVFKRALVQPGGRKGHGLGKARAKE